jgi:hypothetical protein
VLCSLGVLLALLGLSVYSSSPAAAQEEKSQVTMIYPTHSDISPALRDQPALPVKMKQEHEAVENPYIATYHVDEPDTVVQKLLEQLMPNIPAPILNFDGIPFPGVICNCAPPDTNGEVGDTQYVQIVNEGYQVFDKATGNSVFGPVSIESIWSGFGGVCQTAGQGDPVVLYDQIDNRWIITEFANGLHDECIAVSTGSDATGSYARYDYHLSSSNLLDYPKLAVWPDAYYMSMNTFNSSGTTYLGPQAFAFDRTKMLVGDPTAAVIAMPSLGSSFPPMLPADLDGSTLPPAGAPNSFVLWPNTNTYRVYHFSVGSPFGTSPSFTLFGTSPSSGFTQLCPGNRNCVPHLGGGSSDKLDAIGDRLMFRLAYRNFGDHESVVGNFTVSSGGVAGIRWFELRGVTAGPVTTFQQSTYQPDATWRWMGSIAMDNQGNMLLGYSASSSTIFPQIRYTGRLSTDPLNTMAQGEAHLFDGTGAQTGTGNRWGDYSDMTVDPVDDQTFWYTQEYYSSTGTFNWRTRIGSFKLAGGGGGGINLLSAASRLTHGTAGAFDVNMPLTGTSGVEDRSATTYNAVFTFDQPVTSGQVSVLSGTATVGTLSFSGNSITAPLTGVTTAEIVTLRVENVNGDGLPHGDIPFGFLTGDADANRIVASPDRNLVRGQINQPVTSANFREDLNADGRIKSADTQIVRNNLGHSIP